MLNYVQNATTQQSNAVMRAFQLGAIAQRAVLEANELAQSTQLNGLPLQLAGEPTADPIMNEAIRNSRTNPFLPMAWQRTKAVFQDAIKKAWARGEQVPEEIVRRAFAGTDVINNGLDSFISQKQQPQVIVVNGGQQSQVEEQIQNQLIPLLQILENLLSQKQADKVVDNDNKKTDNSSESVEVSKLQEMFNAADKDGKDGVSKEEFVNYIVQEHERISGKRFTNANDPDMAKVKKQAENLFETLKDPKETNLTKTRFDKVIEYYDKASDGKKDGKINKEYINADLEKFRNEGKDVKISGGKTLEELVA